MTSNSTGWAVTLVTCGFLVHMLATGVHMGLGVLYVTWLREFDQGKGATSWVVSTAIALMFLLGPFTAYLMRVFGGGNIVFVGGVLISAGYVIASFAKSVTTLIFSIGVVGGCGCCFVYLPCVSIVAQYFDKRRGLAIGIMTTGVGFGAFTFSPLFTYLEVEYGWQGSLLITAGITLHLCPCGMLFSMSETKTQSDVASHTETNITTFQGSLLQVVEIEVRQSQYASHYSLVSEIASGVGSRNTSRIDVSEEVEKDTSELDPKTLREQFENQFKGLLYIVRDNAQFVFLLSNILTNMSYFLPAVYLVDRAAFYGISVIDGSFLVSVNGIGTIVGRLLSGALIDRQLVDIMVLYIGVLLVFGVSTCASVLCEHSYAAHVAYAACSGATIGSWSTLITPVVVDLAGVDMVGEVYGIFMLFFGVALGFGPPLAGWLVDITGDFIVTFLLFGATIIVSALMMVPIAVTRLRGSSVKS